MKANGILVIALALLMGCDSGEDSLDDNKQQEQVEQLEETVEPPTEGRPRSPEQLADAYMQAVNAQDTSAIEGLIYWDGVENRKSTETWIKMILRNELSSVAVTSLTEEFKTMSNNGFDRNGVHFVPNLDVEYVLTPRSEKGDGQVSIGKKEKEWFIVAYIPAE